MTFRLKITLSMLCLLSLLFGAGGSALITISYNTALERETDSAFGSYQTLLNTLSLVSQIDEWTGSEDVSRTLEKLQEQNASGISALSLTSDASKLYESGAAAVLMSQIRKPKDTEQCLISSFESEGRHFLQLTGAFYAGEEMLYLDAAYDVSSVYAARDEQRTTFHKVFVIMVVVCAILSHTIAWLLTRPLAQLSKASGELARGNLGYRAALKTDDEVGALASDFNDMASQLEQGFSLLQSNLSRQERFMGSFAHELKTPMTSIIGYAELIRSQTLSSEEQMEAAHFIFSEGKRLETLSLKLLDILVAEEQTLKLQLIPPASLISQLVEHLRPIYEKYNIRLHYKCSSGSCMMDPDLVKSLLINLLDNARKAMADGGDIEITSKVSKGLCLITVTDNGKGIPPEALAHLTEAFYRVDKSRAREQGGVGLGLALCSKIVELHGGKMRFESSEGAGTRVSLILRGGRK